MCYNRQTSSLIVNAHHELCLENVFDTYILIGTTSVKEKVPNESCINIQRKN